MLSKEFDFRKLDSRSKRSQIFTNLSHILTLWAGPPARGLRIHRGFKKRHRISDAGENINADYAYVL